MANIAKSVDLVGRVIGWLFGEGVTIPSQKYSEKYFMYK